MFMPQRYYALKYIAVKFYECICSFVWLIGIAFVYLQRKKKGMKGTGLFPFSFYTTMSTFNLVETVQKLLLPLLEEDVFLIEIKVKPINNIKIFLDADNGLGIERCIKINRALYKVMEEMAFFPEGDFSLEVSSPGIGEPLKQHRQYVKNIGRDVEVILNDDVKITGKLSEVDDEHIIIEITEGKGKKAVIKNEEILFSNIKHTKVLIKF
jgi:ribosome maturation factor RimP